jgi:anhydro-N-acetylmuramic acid kinase
MQKYTAIGIMSGTSLDGLDIALCEFTFDNSWSFNIAKARTIDYSDKWRDRLSKAQKLSGFDLLYLDKLFGRYIGESVNDFLSDVNMKIDFIASHGHTVFHQPEKKLTLQIGSGAEICSTTGINCILDFRSLDIALGGQGAPLVPIGDKMLFSEYSACINIGGFANISFNEKNKRIAYDICPANIILNNLSQKLGSDFDNNGDFGKQGQLNTKLLSELNGIPYYNREYPKSLGREWLEKEFMPIIEKSEISIIDKITTVYHHIAEEIVNSINSNLSKVLITGGGAYNKFLIDLIKHKSKSEIIIPSKEIVEFKEALIFTFLGVLRLRNENNTLATVTGAKKDSSGGTIFLSS